MISTVTFVATTVALLLGYLFGFAAGRSQGKVEVLEGDFEDGGEIK